MLEMTALLVVGTVALALGVLITKGTKARETRAAEAQDMVHKHYGLGKYKEPVQQHADACLNGCDTCSLAQARDKGCVPTPQS